MKDEKQNPVEQPGEVENEQDEQAAMAAAREAEMEAEMEAENEWNGGYRSDMDEHFSNPDSIRPPQYDDELSGANDHHSPSNSLPPSIAQENDQNEEIEDENEEQGEREEERAESLSSLSSNLYERNLDAGSSNNSES